MWIIRDRDNQARAVVKALEYVGEWLGERYVSVDIESPEPIRFEIGDWMEYRGERFEINYDPSVIKSAPAGEKGDAFAYSGIKINSLADELTRCDFLDVVPADNEIHYTSLPVFDFFASSVNDLALRLQANLDRLYKGEKKWTVICNPEFAENTDRNISVNKIKCWDALDFAVREFGAYFYIKGRTITIGIPGMPADHIFKYGKGNGLYEIEQNADTDQLVVTRLRAYGNTTNLPFRYYHRYPPISRACAPIHSVVSRQYLESRLTIYLVTFRFLHDYIDASKCEQTDNGLWLTVWIEDRPYAAQYFPGTSQITIGSMPTEGYTGGGGHVLSRSQADRIKEGTTVYFDCYKEDAPGIVLGNAFPNNMAVTRLMLPGFPQQTLDPFVDSANIDRLGVREHTIFFDGSDDTEDIHPSIEGMTAEQLIEAGVPTTAAGRLDEIVRAEQIEDNGVGVVDGSEIVPQQEKEQFTITIKDVGFDINEYWTEEQSKISFKSGKLGGREFDITQEGRNKPVRNADGTWTLTLTRVYDEAVQLFFPNSSYNAEPEDRFVILHIDMPDAYIKAASQRLLAAAKEWLSHNDYARIVYNPKVDEQFMARQHELALSSPGMLSLHDTLCEGMLMKFSDDDLNVDAQIFIDKLTIKENDSNIPKYEVTLKEEKTVSKLDKLQNKIDSLTGSSNTAGSADLRQFLAYGQKYFLSKTAPDSTPYQLGVGSLKTNNFVSGLFGGIGAGIDERGNAEFESAVIRTALTVMELVINRQSVMGGDSIFSEGGTIENAEFVAASPDGTQQWMLTLKEQYEGEVQEIQPGMVVRGVVNNLFDAAIEGSQALYYTSWMRVNGAELGTSGNRVSVTLYPDNEVPSGKNYPPCALMKLARWGHQTNEALQRLFMLSSHEGTLIRYEGVDKPIIDIGNIASLIGRAPAGLFDDIPGVKAGDEVAYFKTLLGNFIQTDHKGKPVPTIIDTGLYDPAKSYRHEAWNEDGSQFLTEDCWHMGCRWRCMADGTIGVEPGYGVTAWGFVSGDPSFIVDFEEKVIVYDQRQLQTFGATLTLTATKYNCDVLPFIKADNIQWGRESYDSHGALRAESDMAWKPTTDQGNKRLLLSFADLGYDGTPIGKITFWARVALDDADVQTIGVEIS